MNNKKINSETETHLTWAVWKRAFKMAWKKKFDNDAVDAAKKAEAMRSYDDDRKQAFEMARKGNTRVLENINL